MGPALADGVGAGLDHVRGRVEIWFTDLQVDDVASLRFQRAGSDQHLERCLRSEALHSRCELHHSLLLPTVATPCWARITDGALAGCLCDDRPDGDRACQHGGQPCLHLAVGWEYLILERAEADRLGDLGREGWELVAVGRADDGVELFLKRPLPGFREQITLEQRSSYVGGGSGMRRGRHSAPGPGAPPFQHWPHGLLHRLRPGFPGAGRTGADRPGAGRWHPRCSTCCGRCMLSG